MLKKGDKVTINSPKIFFHGKKGVLTKIDEKKNSASVVFDDGTELFCCLHEIKEYSKAWSVS